MKEAEGIIGRKLGMTQVFDETGRLEAVTAVAAGPCFVTQVKTPEKDGYHAVQLGYGEEVRPLGPSDSRSLTPPRRGISRPAGSSWSTSWR